MGTIALLCELLRRLLWTINASLSVTPFMKGRSLLLTGKSFLVTVGLCPWGGGKKRGVENLTNDTPPKKGFWTPPRTVRFPPPSGVSALFFLYKNPRQSRPEALLEGSKNFRESAFSGTFSSPIRFAPPISRQGSRETLSRRTRALKKHSLQKHVCGV